MDRESIDVSVSASGDGRPVLAVDVSDATAGLEARLAAPGGGELPADDVDVTFRETGADQPGVLALSNRLTGEFVLEANVERGDILSLVDAVLDADDDRREYDLRLSGVDDRTDTYAKETLLVYDEDGNLRRNRSLIPGGVEL